MNQVRGSALVSVEEGCSDGARALAGVVLGSEGFLVSPWWASSQGQLLEAAVVVGDNRPPFWQGDGKLVLTGGMQGAEEPDRVRTWT